jgi:hypothetical protein
MNSLMNQNPWLIISSPNQREEIVKQDIVKISMFFQLDIFLNLIIDQYARTEIPATNNPTGPLVSVAKPMEIPVKRAYLKPLFSFVSLILSAMKYTERKIKKLKKGSIIPDFKYM